MAPNMYSRIEINLLPPELRPRPAVRYTALVNAVVITLTVVYIGTSIYFNLTEIVGQRLEHQRLQEEVQNREPVRQDYDALKQIEADLQDYGRIITMASADYVDLPVVLARLAALLPDGVYLSRVTNQGSRNRGTQIEVAITLRSAQRDEKLLVQTLTNLKRDPIMANCYMRKADLTEAQLASLQDLYEAKWEVTVPGTPDQPQHQEYEFELMVRLDRVLPEAGLTAIADESKFFEGFTLKPAPAAAETVAEVPGSRTPPASNAPGDVKVEGTN